MCVQQHRFGKRNSFKFCFNVYVCSLREIKSRSLAVHLTLFWAKYTLQLKTDNITVHQIYAIPRVPPARTGGRL